MRIDLGPYVSSYEARASFSVDSDPRALWDKAFGEQASKHDNLDLRAESVGYRLRGYGYSLLGLLRPASQGRWLLTLEYWSVKLDSLPPKAPRRPPRELTAKLGTLSDFVNQVGAVARDIELHVHLDSEFPREGYKAIFGLPLLELPAGADAPFDRVIGLILSKEDAVGDTGHEVVIERRPDHGPVVSVRLTMQGTLDEHFPQIAFRRAARVRDSLIRQVEI